jgi:hypothetical protein
MDVSSFGGKSPYEFLPDSRQDNTYPDNDDSSSKCTFIPDDEDAEEDDDFFGLDHYTRWKKGWPGLKRDPMRSCQSSPTLATIKTQEPKLTRRGMSHLLLMMQFSRQVGSIPPRRRKEKTCTC